MYWQKVLIYKLFFRPFSRIDNTNLRTESAELMVIFFLYVLRVRALRYLEEVLAFPSGFI